jgi:Leucine-rich repeat (LRR) protein
MTWGIALFLLLIVGGGLSYLFLERKDKDPISSGESTRDVGTLLDPLVVELRSLIAPTDEDLLPFLDATSPQSKALAWLQQDKITLTYGRSTRTVLERYVLAVLYYSTMGPFWSSDNRGYNRFNFVHSSDVCDWNDGVFDVTNYTSLLDVRWMDTSGVYCANDGESIDILSLSDDNLHGSIPWELVLLTNLAYINIQMNALSGSIPTRINELTSLQFFSAAQSRLTGTLPELSSPLMRIISLSGNEFTGPIPDRWGATMPELAEIILVMNLLTGSLPASIGRLSNLGNLNVGDNQLTGTLPSDMGELSSLLQLSLSGNMLTGTLSSWIGQLSNLSVLEVSSNQLTGTLPSVLAELNSLQYIFLSTNQLMGTLPASFGRLSNLIQLNVDHNQLTGTIPSDLGMLTSLFQLLLSFNMLTGTLPSWIGRLSRLSILDVASNQLTGTFPSDLREMNLFTASFQENSFTGSMDESLCLLPNVLVRVDCAAVNCSCCDCCTDEACAP